MGRTIEVVNTLSRREFLALSLFGAAAAVVGCGTAAGAETKTLRYQGWAGQVICPSWPRTLRRGSGATITGVARQPIVGTAPSGAATVLRAVLDHGPVARSTIARRTGLSHASVTRQCTELVARGLVRDLPELVASNRIGRPHLPVGLGRRVVGAAHIALEETTLAMLDLRGRVLARERLTHVDATPAGVLGVIAARMPGFLDEHTVDRRPVALAVRAVRAGIRTSPSFVDILAAARNGDAVARELFVERARTVGRLVASSSTWSTRKSWW